jgi:hypothetical protein
MAKFEAYAEYTTVLRIDIEADSVNEAVKLANEIDGGDWQQVDIDGWTVTHVLHSKGVQK